MGCPFQVRGRIDSVTDQFFEERKQKIYRFMQDGLYVPMKQKEIAAVLQIPREERDELRKILEALTEEGKITVSKRGKYSLSKEIRLTGVFRANLKGFGFVTVEGRRRGYLYPGRSDKRGPWIKTRWKSLLPEQAAAGTGKGRVQKIVKRGTARVVGLFQMNPGKNYGFVLPDNQKLFHDIFIPAERSMGAVDGHKVVARS